jgi:hypothetical protein
MNYTSIILFVVIILLLYILYKYFTTSVSTLSTSASLKVSNPTITKLNNPTATRYAYGIWVFVNTWDTSNTKTIFSRDKNIKVYLDTNTPTLHCGMTLTDTTVQDIVVTTNFPIQKWTYITVNVDGQFVDCYLDGKLVVSTKLKTVAATPGDSGETSSPVVLGNGTTSSGFDAFVAGFQNWSNPVGPQDVWNAYMAGSESGYSLSKIFGTYNVDISLLKNNVQQTSFSLF